jgi:predicted transposase
MCARRASSHRGHQWGVHGVPAGSRHLPSSSPQPTQIRSLVAIVSPLPPGNGARAPRHEVARGQSPLTQGVDVGRISPYNRGMKLILQIQLLPDTEAAAKMKAAIERFNEAATWLAGVAFEKEITRAFNLHHVAYRDIREKFGLPADMAVRCLAQVCEASARSPVAWSSPS